jgi:hypothetical protein
LGTSEQREHDTVEYLESVLAKWSLYERKERIARSLPELARRVQRQPREEVFGVLLASAKWHRGGATIGFCEFRRTWCNHIVFDFLGVHPELLRGTARPISGVGTALLYRLALVAQRLRARMIWAETSESSASYYASVFGLSEPSDLLRVEGNEFLHALESAIAPRKQRR